jgi:hypothetical protein
MTKQFILLFSFAFASALNAQDKIPGEPRIIRQWSLTQDFTGEIPVEIDTIFSLFNRYRLTDRYSPLNAYPGNYGLPFYQINFFDRIIHPEKFLYSYYYPLMYLSDRTIFMNTQVPFTELVWTYGGARNIAEQTFRVKHSQNVNRFLNFGLIYDIIYNLGHYSYQSADNKNFTFFTSYTGDKYELYFSAGINNHIAFENGGVSDKEQLSQFETRDVAVNLGGLNRAKSELRNNSILIVQRYALGRGENSSAETRVKDSTNSFRLSGTFSHIAVLENNRRTYSDNYPASGFYDTVFISQSTTFDSLSSRILKNTLRFDFSTDKTRKFRFGGGFGLRNEMVKYSQIIPTHNSFLADTATWRHSNNAITGRLYNNIGEKFRWTVNGELYLSGYRAGDFRFDGAITKSFDLNKGRADMVITGSLSNTRPSFWYQQWGGNHFEWSAGLDKELRTDIGASLSYPARSAMLKFNYALIDNYTDFNFDALPSQHTGGLSVAAVVASKEFTAWKFHLATDLILQQSSNRQVLDLPLASIRTAGFFEHLFIFRSTDGRLRAQIGADLTIHTLYNSYAYMPATGRYYRQNLESVGNYPFINVFLNLKLKRTRILVMLDHVNSGLSGYDYYMIPSYPVNIRMLRYGIGWTFYD